MKGGFFMTMKLIIEAIAYSLVYAAFMVILFRIQGAKKQLYNYPPAILERAVERGITTKEEQNANAKKNKILGILVMAALCVFITCVINGQDTFGAGFTQAYIFLNVFSLFDVLIGVIL